MRVEFTARRATWLERELANDMASALASESGEELGEAATTCGTSSGASGAPRRRFAGATRPPGGRQLVDDQPVGERKGEAVAACAGEAGRAPQGGGSGRANGGLEFKRARSCGLIGERPRRAMRALSELLTCSPAAEV